MVKDSAVGEVRQCGLMCGIELAPPDVGLSWGRQVSVAATRRGVLIRPLGDVVVIMGEEVTHPNKDAPYARKIEHRRFTDVWKQFEGVWKLWIRQATITKVE